VAGDELRGDHALELVLWINGYHRVDGCVPPPFDCLGVVTWKKPECPPRTWSASTLFQSSDIDPHTLR
jgi:hypothetical protein